MTEEQKQVVKALRCYASGFADECQTTPCCDKCPNWCDTFDVAEETDVYLKKAADLIEQLVLERDAAVEAARIADDKRMIAEGALADMRCERDAAVKDINAVLRGKQLVCAMCDQEFCPEYGNEEKPSGYCDEAKWRGECVENGGDENA